MVSPDFRSVIRNVCGDAQFRIRVQQHHDLLLAAASSAPRVVHISTAKQENCGGETDNGEMTECIDSSRVAASPATCSLLSFDRVHVPLMVARADPRRHQLPPLIFDTKKHENQASQDTVETAADWGSSGDALRVTAARATLLLHSLVQRTDIRTNISFDAQSRFVVRALRKLAHDICANTKCQPPLNGQSVPHNFVAPAYKSGHMTLNGFVKKVVEMQNRELKAWIDMQRRKLKNSSSHNYEQKLKSLAEKGELMRVDASIFDSWMRGTTMPRLKCGFVIWDDQKTQETQLFHAVAAQKPLLPPAGSPSHPMTAPSTSLQLGSYDAKGHESNNVISLTGDDGATSNSGSVGEVEDITESFKRKRFEMQMQRP